MACLSRAIAPSDLRNMLAHGHWWAFDVHAGSITVRAATDWPNEEMHRDFTEEEIDRTTALFEELEAELFNCKGRLSDDESADDVCAYSRI